MNSFLAKTKPELPTTKSSQKPISTSTLSKSSSSFTRAPQSFKGGPIRLAEIEESNQLPKKRPRSILAGGIVEQNKTSLRLKDADNAITKSDLYERTLHLQSAASGHQSASGKGPGVGGLNWNLLRAKKLKAQSEIFKEEQDEQVLSIFEGVIVWISGSTGVGLTDRHVKEAVVKYGGETRMNLSSSCTHYVSLQLSSGRKAEKYYKAKAPKLKLVSPNWILDSIQIGKRLSEANYSIVDIEGQSSIHEIFSEDLNSPRKKKKLHPADYVSGADVPYSLAPLSPTRPLRNPMRKIVVESEEEEDFGAPPSAQPRSR